MKIFLGTFLQRCWRDVLVAGLLGVSLGYATFQGGKLIPPDVFDLEAANSSWFESDTDRVCSTMILSTSEYHWRTKLHPLFSLLTQPIVHVVTKTFHLKPLTTVRLFIACVAFLWVVVLFTLLRAIGCHRLDSTLFSLLASVSAASVFWFTVPESFSFGSLGIVATLLVVAITRKYSIAPLWYILVNIGTLSFVITDWMAGIIATVVMNRPFRRALEIMAYAFSIVTILWGVEKFMYTEAKFFLGDRGERRFIFNEGAGGPAQKLQSFYCHTLVAPAIRVVDRYPKPNWPILTTQNSAPGSATPWGMCAVILWGILLILGVWALFSLKEHFELRLVLGLTLLGQCALHMIYGDETFLYSLHFVTLLLPLVALVALTRLRWVALVLTILLIPCVAINNITQFRAATKLISSPDFSKGMTESP